MYHTALYGAVPPDQVAVIVIDCPLSIFGLTGVIEDIESTWFTVNVEEYTELTVVGCASVTITLNCSGLLATSADVVVYTNVLLVDTTFVYNVLDIMVPVMLFEISQL